MKYDRKKLLANELLNMCFYFGTIIASVCVLISLFKPYFIAGSIVFGGAFYVIGIILYVIARAGWIDD